MIGRESKGEGGNFSKKVPKCDSTFFPPPTGILSIKTVLLNTTGVFLVCIRGFPGNSVKSPPAMRESPV